jgi:fermentation-respiration switch protein FrsA (DUF1100 family)
MRRIIRIVFAMAAALLLAGCAGALFYPSAALVRTPADLGLAYRDVALRAEDGVALHGWWLEAEAPVRGTVLFLHGNAENISTHIASVYWLPRSGYQVLLLDYRGFGRSAGRAQLTGVLADVRAAFDWLGREPAVAGRPLYLLGQSVGASLGGFVVGSEARLRVQLSGVLLDSGFARLGWIAREVAARGALTWALQWPIAWSMPRGYDLLDVAGDIQPVPLLLMHGRDDRIVPYRHAEALYAVAREPRFLLSYDGDHIAGFRDAGIRAAVLAFFADAADGRVDGDALRAILQGR